MNAVNIRLYFYSRFLCAFPDQLFNDYLFIAQAGLQQFAFCFSLLQIFHVYCQSEYATSSINMDMP